MARTPAGIDEFPLAVVNSTGIPSVGGLEGRHWIIGSDWHMAKTLACTGADDTFETSLESEGREEPSIALTNGLQIVSGKL